ncbi:flagellin [Rubellimicrobium aerolatum]|uniref:Flagellin n=1 Tax=Rubellimicrobium aerolatum TaxID=490979 RepID=A0ABW0S9X4_9RHOB|nr:flagellin [Rubellimicrobium aerolatum]MBP1805090.1 flagellar hook-associated protein 3 FlgL [Rubellimicrobium aerolatum]
MSVTGLGDRAQLLLGLRQNTEIRTRLAARSQELSTGVASDMVAHRKGDTAPLADLDRRVALAKAYGSAAKEAATRLGLVDEALERVETARSGLFSDLVTATAGGNLGTASASARSAFATIVSALNTQLGDDGLFAGTATGGTALASADAMMADILATMAGVTTAAGVEAGLDDWFAGTGDGFGAAYQGSDADARRDIDADTRVRIGVRADDPTLRGLLRAAALGALAADVTLDLPDEEAGALIEGSRDALLSLSSPLTELRAGIGLGQSRVDQAIARHAAKASAWQILRNELAEVDPYGTASEVEALQTQLETHYEMTQRLSSLSLMSYLR